MSEPLLRVLPSGRRTDPRSEVDEVLREIEARVRRREELRRRGASERELEPHREAIARLHWRLARAARASATDEGPAAA